LYATGSLRRVKKYDFELQKKGEEFALNLSSCSRSQSVALPLVKTGYHRGLDRTLGLCCKEIRDKGLLSDKEIIDALLDSHTLHRTKAVALIATWEPKK
jgi:hypothetical protein